MQRNALDFEGFASFASFSVLTGAPIPLAMGGLFRRAEIVAAERAAERAAEVEEVPESNSFDVMQLWPFSRADSTETEEKSSTVLVDTDIPEPRDLMWAFPSFAVFLEDPENTAPSNLPTWARWLCLATFWPGVIWYLYYKLLVEDDLRQYKGLGIGGSLVIIPFAIGLFAGVFGEFAFGSLEGGPLDNPFSCAFYGAFAWIYLNQWFLYNKVNQLFEEEGRPAPLDAFGLFVPGWNFVTGIRQIHFLAEYWAIKRGEVLPRDAFAELFPFAKKSTLTFLELATTPSLWFDLGAILG